MQSNVLIESWIQRIQQRHHLHRRALGTQRRESDDIAEVYRNTLVRFRLNRLTRFEHIGDASGSIILYKAWPGTAVRVYLGSIWYNSWSARFLSSSSCWVLSSTMRSRLVAYFSSKDITWSIRLRFLEMSGILYTDRKTAQTKPIYYTVCSLWRNRPSYIYVCITYLC